MVKTIYHITCSKGHTFEGDHDTTHCLICDEKISWQWEIKTEKKSDLTVNQLLCRTYQWLEKHDPNFVYGELQEHDADYIGQQIILTDWNRIPYDLTNFIEKKCNALTGFNDEYALCSCGKIISTTPNYHGDQKNYIVTDSEILCRKCVFDDAESIIDDFKNDPEKALPDWFYPEIEKAGFICYSPDEYCQKFETGFHPGQDDDPAKVAKDIEENLPGYDYIFKIDNIGQFDMEWSVFIRKNEEE